MEQDQRIDAAATKVRHYILREFEERQSRNTRYSMRSFARDLGLAPSHLLGLLRGRHGLSLARANRVADGLKLTTPERAFFLALVQARHSRSQMGRSLGNEQVLELGRSHDKSRGRRLRQDEFSLISDWYHLAILELVRLADFRPVLSWAAKRLALSERTILGAWRRLERLNLVQSTDQGWAVGEARTDVFGDVPSQAIRHFHKGLIGKAQLALDRQPLSEREVQSVVFAFRDSQMEKARARIREFCDSFSTEFGSEEANRSEGQDEIYGFTVHFFRLTQKGADHEIN